MADRGKAQLTEWHVLRERNSENVHPFPKQPAMRSPEQIREQLEARMRELEWEYTQPALQKPCSTCRWKKNHLCENALIKGFGEPLPNMDWQIEKCSILRDKKVSRNWPEVGLCGFERALWEPVPAKLTRWQRFVNWFLAPWKES